MATVKNTRAAKAASVLAASAHSTGAAAIIKEVCQRLKIVMAVAYTTSLALKHQNADNDANAALALQRCVGDELDRQIGRLETVIAGGES